MNTYFKTLIKTQPNLAAFVARITLMVVILPHGLQKTLGLFGGYGFSGTMKFFTESAGLPWLVAFLVIMAESLGALAIGLGFLTRFCAASLIVVMLGAIFTVHLDHGFFMNWFGNQAGEGFEYHLLVIGLALSLVISGSGSYSVDSKLQ
jgi:putative oxidoreductase